VLAFVLLLRWAGLRIGDAISLERSRLTAEGRIMLYMAKTGNPVCVLIPEYVSQLLHSLPNSNPKYFFWTGNGLLKTAAADWQRTLRRLFKFADLDKRCHPHMFRDTFAVELLLAGVPIDQVSMLLGHSSVKITEKHYSPWVHARQQQLEESVLKAWAAVPVGLIEQPAQASVRVNYYRGTISA
jgi:integrase